MVNSGSNRKPLFTRTYGNAEPQVVLLHGGPAAAGYMGTVAEALADWFQVLEPFQRGSGGERLTVARHVEDLHDVVLLHCGDERPVIVGHSWGAMLALAYGAAHPDRFASLVLIGCGAFDPTARAQLVATREARIDADLRRRLARLNYEIRDPDERLCAMGELIKSVDSFDLIPHKDETLCDLKAHEETWEDMIRLQERGVYPAAFDVICTPVLMMHGEYDPHPGAMIRDGLGTYLPQLEYTQWDRCGHYPWLEKATRHEFHRVLREWLVRHSGR